MRFELIVAVLASSSGLEYQEESWRSSTASEVWFVCGNDGSALRRRFVDAPEFAKEGRDDRRAWSVGDSKQGWRSMGCSPNSNVANVQDLNSHVREEIVVVVSFQCIIALYSRTGII